MGGAPPPLGASHEARAQALAAERGRTAAASRQLSPHGVGPPDVVRGGVVRLPGVHQPGDGLADDAAQKKGEAKQPCPACLLVAQPVNPISGAKILADQRERDFALPAVLPFAWQRTYSSALRLAGWLGRTGLAPGAQVVVYDRQGANYCGRLWWMLKWCGHEAVAVLDGGLQAWLEAGGATDSGPGPAP